MFTHLNGEHGPLAVEPSFHDGCLCFPGRTSPDVSLYDHLEMTAAIGACISEYLLEAEETDYKARLFDHEAVFRGEAAFLMVTADMSGIQRFMYCILTAGK